MKTIITTIAVATTLALGPTVALAEEAVPETRAQLDEAWGRTEPAAESIAAGRVTEEPPAFAPRNRDALGPLNAWAGNFRGGRVHEPSGGEGNR